MRTTLELLKKAAPPRQATDNTQAILLAIASKPGTMAAFQQEHRSQDQLILWSQFMSCIFCKILSGEIPAKLIYQDESVAAFHDNNPQAPTHILIIPKKHINTLNELAPEDAHLIGQLGITAKQLAHEAGIAEAGYRLVLNCNQAGGQSVYHIHMHLLGGRSMQWPPG